MRHQTAEQLIREWFGLAVGGLGWSPRVFWRSTVSELFMAITGYNRFHQARHDPMTRDEMDEIFGEHEDVVGSIRKPKPDKSRAGSIKRT